MCSTGWIVNILLDDRQAESFRSFLVVLGHEGRVDAAAMGGDQLLFEAADR